MKILALDLGKYKSVACVYETASLRHRFTTIVSTPQALHDLLVVEEPERVVIEICPLAGWVSDLVETLGIALEVASTTHDAWRWKNVKRKNDRQDGLKLAQLSALGQLTLVHMPAPRVRQWRALINYRQRLVSRRTRIRNHIRALLLGQAVVIGRGAGAWTRAGIAQLKALARPLAEVAPEELWRGELELELAALEALTEPLREVEQKLNELSAANKGVQLLRTIPGVGPRGAEAMVAVLDEVQRFKRGKEVGAYLGLVPKQIQSGESNRLGRITHQGNRLLRSLLIEISWSGLRYNSWMRAVYERVRRGSQARKKIAIVAVARRLLIRCWAMLRDGTRWHPALSSS